MAASGNAIRAGHAFVELFADNTPLVRGLRTAKTHLTKFGNEVKDIGLKVFSGGMSGVTALAGAAKVYAQIGDSVASAAKRTGMSAEAFSALAYAAKFSDVEASDLEGSLRKMQKTLASAAGGSQSAEENFTALGLSAKALLALTPEQQFMVLADRLAKIENPAMRAAAAMKVFGRGGVALMPMMEGGAAGISALTDEAARLGLVIGTKDALAAEALEQSIKKMWMTVKMVVFNIGGAVAPVFQKAAAWVTRAAVSVSQWIRQNQGLIVTALEVCVAVAAVGAGMIAFGMAVKFVAGVIGGVMTVISVLHTVFGAVAAAISFLVTPVGLVIAGIVALGGVLAYVLYRVGAFDNAIQSARNTLAELAAETKTTFGAMANALKAGDIAAAVKVLWAYIKMEFMAGKNWLLNLWDTVWGGFRKGVNTGGALIVGGAMVVWNGIADGLDTAVAFMLTAWDGFVAALANGWEDVKAAAKKAWNYVKSTWDGNFDLNAANAQVDAGAKAAKDTNNRKSGESYDENQAVLDERKKARHAGLDKMLTDTVAYNDNIDEENAKKAADRAAELEKARAEWMDAVKAANEAKPADLAGKPGNGNQFAGLDIPEAMKRADVRGTFSSMAVLSLQTGNMPVQERIAKGIDKIAKNTERMMRDIEDMDGQEFE